MEEKNGKTETSFFKKNFNYPILLFALISLTNISSIYNSIIGIFKYPGAIVSILANLILYVTPIAIAVFLWLYKNKGFEKASIAIAAVLSAATLLTAYSWIRTVINSFSYLSFDIEFVIGPLPNLLGTLFYIIICAILVFNLFANRKNYGAFYVLLVLFIVELCFFGLLRTYAAVLDMGSASSAFSCFFDVLLALAIWYIPGAINNPPAAELSTGKAKALAMIAAVVVGLYFIASAAAGGPSGGSDSYWDDYDDNHDGKIDDNEFGDGWKDYVDDFLN